MSVNLQHVPAEHREFLRDGHHVHDVLVAPVDLQTVVVHEGAEVIQLVVACRHGGFPDHAFLEFAVAQQRVDPARIRVRLAGQRHADRRGYALTERAGGHLHAGEKFLAGVALQAAAQSAQGHEVFFREESAFRQAGVQRRRRMPLGEDEAVPALLRGIRRVDVHFTEVQGGEDIGSRKTAAGMAGSRRIYFPYDVLPYCLSDLLQLYCFHVTSVLPL